MRMHEILGVEPGERFLIAKGSKDECFVNKFGFMSYASGEECTSLIVCYAINNGIIRKPRLTGEQIEHLKALNLLGYKYLYLSHYGYCYASTTEPILTGTTAELPSNRTLNDLLKTVKIPLDIVQVLKDAGAEI